MTAFNRSLNKNIASKTNVEYIKGALVFGTNGNVTTKTFQTSNDIIKTGLKVSYTPSEVYQVVPSSAPQLKILNANSGIFGIGDKLILNVSGTFAEYTIATVSEVIAGDTIGILTGKIQTAFEITSSVSDTPLVALDNSSILNTTNCLLANGVVLGSSEAGSFETFDFVNSGNVSALNQHLLYSPGIIFEIDPCSTTGNLILLHSLSGILSNGDSLLIEDGGILSKSTISAVTSGNTSIPLLITGSSTSSPLYALDGTSLPTLTNMTISGNIATATTNAASAQTFDFVESVFTIKKITPSMKFTPGIIFNVDPTSTIGNLKITPGGLLVTGDKILVEQSGAIVETSIISLSTTGPLASIGAAVASGTTAYRICSYMIGTDTYISVTHATDNTFKTFKWNGTAFASIGTAISTGSLPDSLCSYMIGTDTYISVATNGAASFFTYKWNGTAFAQVFTTGAASTGTSGICSYMIGTDTYISTTSSSGNTFSTYKWNGTNFTLIGTVATGTTPQLITAYMIGADSYISVANNASNNFSTYKWNGTTFVSIGAAIATGNANQGITSYMIGTDSYISVGSVGSAAIYSYKWNGTTFVSIGAPITGVNAPRSITSFSIGTNHYLASANYESGTVSIFKWNGTAFALLGTPIASATAHGIVAYTIGTTTYISASSHGSGNFSTFNFTDVQDTITSPSLSVAVPTWVAKGGQTFQYSVSATSTPSFILANGSSFTRIGNLVTKNYSQVTGLTGTHVQLKASAFNNGDALNSLSASLDSLGYGYYYKITSPSLPITSSFISKFSNAMYYSNSANSTPNFQNASISICNQRRDLNILNAIDKFSTYGLNSTNVPNIINGTISNGIFTASANSASVQTFDYTSLSIIDKCSPMMKFTPNDIFTIDPTSTIGNLKLSTLTANLSNGDKILAEQSGLISEISIITTTSLIDTTSETWYYAAANGLLLRLARSTGLIQARTPSEIAWTNYGFLSHKLPIDRLNNIVYLNGYYYVGYQIDYDGSHTSKIFRSPDLTTWTAVIAVGVYAGGSSSVEVINGYLVACFGIGTTNFKSNGSFRSYYSSNGTDWTLIEYTDENTGTALYQVLHASVSHGRLSLCGYNHQPRYTSNGTSLTAVANLSVFNSVRSVLNMLWSGTQWIAACIGSTGNAGIFTSSDDSTWTKVTSGDIGVSNVVWNGTYYYFVVNGGNFVYYSIDGTAWNYFTVAGATFSGLITVLDGIVYAWQSGTNNSWKIDGLTYTGFGSKIYSITSPSLSVAVPTWVAKGGQKLQYSVSATSTPSFLNITSPTFTRVGNLVTKTSSLISNLSGTHVQLKVLNLNSGDTLSALTLNSNISKGYNYNSLSSPINGNIVSNVFTASNNNASVKLQEISKYFIESLTASFKLTPGNVFSIDSSSTIGNLKILNALDGLLASGDKILVEQSGIISEISIISLTSAQSTSVISIGASIAAGTTPYSICSYMIGSDSYITAPGYASNNFSTYKWNGTAFASIGTAIATGAGAFGCCSYVIGADTYLSLTNGTPNTISTYKWNGTAWASIGTAVNTGAGPRGITSFIIGADRYLAVGNNGVGSLGIYKWNGTTFGLSQTISSLAGAHYITSYVIGTDTYISLTSTTSTIFNTFKWNGTAFASIGAAISITNVANGIISYSIGADSYLSTGNGASNAFSTFKWNGTTWASIGTDVATGTNAGPLHQYFIGSDAYLSISNFGSTTVSTYKWNGTTWVSVGTAVTSGTAPFAITSQIINSVTYISVVNNTSNNVSTFRVIPGYQYAITSPSLSVAVPTWVAKGGQTFQYSKTSNSTESLVTYSPAYVRSSNILTYSYSLNGLLGNNISLKFNTLNSGDIISDVSFVGDNGPLIYIESNNITGLTGNNITLKLSGLSTNDKIYSLGCNMTTDTENIPLLNSNIENLVNGELIDGIVTSTGISGSFESLTMSQMESVSKVKYSGSFIPNVTFTVDPTSTIGNLILNHTLPNLLSNGDTLIIDSGSAVNTISIVSMTSNLILSNIAFSITGSSTLSPLYALDATSLPSLTNMTIGGNIATATANAASAQTFDYLTEHEAIAITPLMKFTPGNIFSVDSSSTIGNLKITPSGLLSNGDGLLVEQSGVISESSPISLTPVPESLASINSAVATGSNPKRIISYMIGTDTYISIANYVASTFSTYKWNGSAFASIGSAISAGTAPTGICSHVIGADRYLITLSSSANAFYTFKWNGSAFATMNIAISTGASSAPNDICNCVIGADTYIITANYGTNTISAFKWNGSTWVSAGTAASGLMPERITSYMIGTDTYVSVTNTGDNTFSTYIWNGTAFASIGAAVATGTSPEAIAAYSIGTDSYISITNADSNNFSTYKWDGTAFVSIGAEVTIPSRPLGISTYSIGTDRYLAFASIIGNSLSVYKWDGTTFISAFASQTVATAVAICSYIIAGKTYISVSSNGAAVFNTFIHAGAYDSITSPALSVAVPTWVAKGGQTLQYSVSTSSTPSFIDLVGPGFTRVGNLVTKNYSQVTGLTGTHVQLKALTLNTGDALSELTANLSEITGHAYSITSPSLSFAVPVYAAKLNAKVQYSVSTTTTPSFTNGILDTITKNSNIITLNYAFSDTSSINGIYSKFKVLNLDIGDKFTKLGYTLNFGVSGFRYTMTTVPAILAVPSYAISSPQTISYSTDGISYSQITSKVISFANDIVTIEYTENITNPDTHTASFSIDNFKSGDVVHKVTNVTTSKIPDSYVGVIFDPLNTTVFVEV